MGSCLSSGGGSSKDSGGWGSELRARDKDEGRNLKTAKMDVPDVTNGTEILDYATELAGGDPNNRTAAHIFESMTGHMTDYRWMWVPGYIGTECLDQAPAQKQGNCRGYRDIFLELLKRANISGGGKGDQDTPYITDNTARTTIDPSWSGNITGTNRFFFTNHYWATHGGSYYDPAMGTDNVNPAAAIEYKQTWKNSDETKREFTNNNNTATVYLQETGRHPRGWTQYTLYTDKPGDWPDHD